MVREPVVSGQFYESGFQELEKQISGCFTAKNGPGDFPVKRGAHKIKAIIVPHAGYSYSGACAAWAYKEIAEAHFPKTFVILAPTHRAYCSGLSLEDWRTPFGIVKTGKDFVIGLKENSNLRINESPHMDEHSLEVQLPFLQFVNKDRLEDLRIAPIAVSHDIDFRDMGKEIAAFVKKEKKDVVYIVSSDFTHYGKSYGYVPFTTDVPDRLTKLDSDAIELIKNLDIKGFSDYLNQTQATICGYMPILVLMTILSEEKDVKSHLLMHYTSADFTGDYRNSVSYASILFK